MDVAGAGSLDGLPLDQSVTDLKNIHVCPTLRWVADLE